MAKRKNGEAKNQSNRHNSAKLSLVNEPQESNSSDSEQILQDTFDDELQWCINKLGCGLQAKGATEKSRQEALKVMTTLTSKNAPLVKKRALMRSTFGDYRKKMALERNSHEKEFLKGLAMSSAKQPQTSSFHKKVIKSDDSSTEHNEFKFNFENEN